MVNFNQTLIWTIIGKALADYHSIHKTIKSFEQDMFPMDQNVLSSILEKIQDYGCWCSFNTIINPIHQIAEPVDQFDKACKALHNGYQCGKIDHNNAIMLGLGQLHDIRSCDPSTHVYESGLLLEDIYMIGMYGDPVDSLKQTCKQVNPDDTCAETACLVEGNFILTMFKIWTDAFYMVDIDSSKILNNGFDRDQECPVRTKANNPNANFKDEEHTALAQSEPQFFCCGEYPIVAPFKQSPDNSRACCGLKSYGLTMQCCDVGNGEMKAQPVCD